MRQAGDPDDGQPAVEYHANLDSSALPSAPVHDPGGVQAILAGLQALKVEQTLAGMSFKERKKAEILALKEAMKKTGMSKKDIRSAQRKNAKQAAPAAIDPSSALSACDGQENEQPSHVFI